MPDHFGKFLYLELPIFSETHLEYMGGGDIESALVKFQQNAENCSVALLAFSTKNVIDEFISCAKIAFETPPRGLLKDDNNNTMDNNNT